MIASVREVIGDAIEQVFETWYDDNTSLMLWDASLVGVMIPCEDEEEGCEASVAYPNDEGGVTMSHASTAMKVTLIFHVGEEHERHIEFLLTPGGVTSGSLHSLLERIRDQVTFDAQSGSLGDVEARMAAILAEHSA